MFKQNNLMFIYTITPVHMGSGQALGVIDNPIQRERHTEHPNMAGSGIKGAIRHHLNGLWDKNIINRLFGPDDSSHAGAISFGDAQVVAFPVRSLKQGFVYAVSPVTLARLKRLAEMTNTPCNWKLPAVEGGKCLTCDARVQNGDRLILEAFDYKATVSDALKTIAAWLADNAIPTGDAHDHFRDKIKTDLVLLPDEDFTHFVKNATVVEPHVRIDPDTGTADAGGLFYTENLPPESLMIAPVFASDERFAKNRPEDFQPADLILKLLQDHLHNKLIQVGGDATTGRGQVVLNFAGGAV